MSTSFLGPFCSESQFSKAVVGLADASGIEVVVVGRLGGFNIDDNCGGSVGSPPVGLFKGLFVGFGVFLRVGCGVGGGGGDVL